MSRRRTRLSVFFAVFFAILAATALFRVSQQVQTAEEDQRRLEAAVASEQESIRVLSAEWDYLNRPDRLEGLAQEYLGMKQPQAQQMEQSPAALPLAHKSLMEAQPVALEGKSAVSTVAPRPAVKPHRSRESSRDFNRLLGDLAPAAGGAR